MYRAFAVNQLTEPYFVEFLKQQLRNNNKDRNSNWFKELLTNDKWRDYYAWTFLHDGNRVVGMAAIQTHGFAKGVYRMMSRYYLVPEVRGEAVQKISKGGDPDVFAGKTLFKVQQKLLDDQYTHLIMTMEHSKKRRIIKLTGDYFNRVSGTKFKLMDHMIKTFDNEDDWRAWQVCVCDSKDGSYPPIPNITYEEYNRRFPNAKLSAL